MAVIDGEKGVRPTEQDLLDAEIAQLREFGFDVRGYACWSSVYALYRVRRDWRVETGEPSEGEPVEESERAVEIRAAGERMIDACRTICNTRCAMVRRDRTEEQDAQVRRIDAALDAEAEDLLGRQEGPEDQPVDPVETVEEYFTI